MNYTSRLKIVYINFPRYTPRPLWYKFITSGSVDNTFFGFLLAAAVATFAPISNARPGFFNTLVANCLPALAESFPKFLKKSPNPSASIVLSLTILDFFRSHITHFSTNNLICLPVFFINCYFTSDIFCSAVVFTTNTITISFKLLRVHL